MDGDVYLTVLRWSFVRTGTSTTPVWMGFSTVSGETSYMDISTTGCGTGAWVRVKTDFSPPKRGRFGDGLGTGQGRCACKNGFFTSYTGGTNGSGVFYWCSCTFG